MRAHPHPHPRPRPHPHPHPNHRYATVIENSDEWDADFGRSVIEGILEHEDAGIPLARRRKESFERLQKRVVAVTKAFAPFDWTQDL